jgi:hypothetical protein
MTNRFFGALPLGMTNRSLGASPPGMTNRSLGASPPGMKIFYPQITQIKGIYTKIKISIIRAFVAKKICGIFIIFAGTLLK